jgi:hypothetical protein
MFLGGSSLVCCQYICSYLRIGGRFVRLSYQLPSSIVANLPGFFTTNSLNRLLLRVLWQKTVTFSVNFVELLAHSLQNFFGKEVSFKVRLTLWFQRDGAPAHFRRWLTEQLNCWYGYDWIGCGRLQSWVPRSPDLTSFELTHLRTYEVVGVGRDIWNERVTVENHGCFGSHSE